MKVRVQTPAFSVRCVRCMAITPIKGLYRPGQKLDIEIGCSCPSEQPVLDLVLAFPAAHHLPSIPLQAEPR